MRRGGAFLAGLVLAFGVVGAAAMLDRSEETRSAGPINMMRPTIDLQESGPFAAGRRVSPATAAIALGGLLPVPPTTASTGELTAIWEEAGQVAFVWRSDLRFYAERSELSPEELLASWEEKLRDEDDPNWILTDVRGVPALARDILGPDQPSSLTFLDRGISMQFVGPSQTLQDLLELADAIAFSDPVEV